ncbi:Hpt domain-containing protein [Photobacterium japonica]|uniref:Hpt domain-containing protein n=1 Tax=Photobacterium japonica TaxID=2910235 RepID=UPI003D0E17B2
MKSRHTLSRFHFTLLVLGGLSICTILAGVLFSMTAPSLWGYWGIAFAVMVVVVGTGLAVNRYMKNSVMASAQVTSEDDLDVECPASTVSAVTTQAAASGTEVMTDCAHMDAWVADKMGANDEGNVEASAIVAPSEPIAPDDPHGWSDLSVFDSDFLLNSMDGCHESVLMLLELFVEDHGQDAVRFSQALDEGSNDSAHRIAHTLKGVAGSVGAAQLHAVSEYLEKQVKTEQTLASVERAWLGRAIMALEQALNTYMQGVREHIEQANTAVEIEEYHAPDPAVFVQRERRRTDAVEENEETVS